MRALALLLVLSAAARADPPPSDPGAAASGITVTLAMRRSLHLVRGPGGAPALDGEVEVTLVNPGPAVVRLVPRHDVHGLVFTPRGGGAPIQLFSDCQCRRDADQRRWSSYGVARGAPRVIRLADFRCGDAPIAPPPPGRYLVTYRTLVYPDPLPPPPGSPREPLRDAPRRCRAELATPSYWAHALTSNPVEVTLTAPRR